MLDPRHSRDSGNPAHALVVDLAFLMNRISAFAGKTEGLR
jgi:hypothetical protein